MSDPVCRECNREPCVCAGDGLLHDRCHVDTGRVRVPNAERIADIERKTDTPLTDASISWHTAHVGYGSDQISLQMEHVEVSDARAIERELREEIAAAHAEVARLREAQIDQGKLWSMFRTLLSQGGDIQLDYNAGKYSCHEEYSARLDAAARERVEQFCAAALAAKEPTDDR